MNVVALMAHAYPMFGGAQLTVWTLLKRLHAKYGFTCELFTPYPLKRHHRAAGVALTTYRDLDEFKAMLQARRPDVLLASLEFAPKVASIAARFEIPTIAYFQSYEYCPPTRVEKERWGLDLTRQYPARAEAEYTFRAADALLANSKYLRNRFVKKYHIAPGVLYPEFELEAVRPTRNPQFITGICGSPYKGIEIFLALADAFPDEKFLLVGDVQPNWMARVRERKNITVRGRAELKQFLRESKIVLVPSQWAEPFGRIAIEAMGNGIPTLVSYTGGLKEIVAASPLGVKRFPSAEAWRVRLSELLSSEKLRDEFSERGRMLASKFLQGNSTRELAGLIQQLAAKRAPKYDAPPCVQLRGDASRKTAFSLINAAWQHALAGASQLNYAQRFQAPDVVIDHDFSQKFTDTLPPPTGKWVVVRPWDFGHYPQTWVTKLNAECDQLWVHSHWIRAQAIASGIDARRVCVVPLGIDPRVFKPNGKKYALATEKRFRFIFVGATVFRKGIDILLRAYAQAFTADDDVCLVIKDHARDVFYQGISYREEIGKLKREPRAPSLIYLNNFLSAAELGSLYRACNVGVFPYRAEGFAMPILEAMACGVPAIVPRFGACLDFCNNQNAFLMPARRISLPIQGKFAFNTLGFEEELSRVESAEVSVNTLAEFMRRAYKAPTLEIKAKGRAGSERALSQFTWKNSAAHVLQEIAALERYDTPYRLRQARIQASQRFEKLEHARRLYVKYLSPSAEPQ